VEKKKNKYFASCAGIESLSGTGDSFHLALEDLQVKLMCHLHDPSAELEIVATKPYGDFPGSSKFKASETLK